jgi:cysteine desulfurase
MTVPPIYLDYHATTPLDPRVLEAMLPAWGAGFGNPHSSDHPHGWQAEQAVETARSQIAALIGAQPREIVFTSGATEANNLAIKGMARFAREHGNRRDHIITCGIEHKCVLESVRRMEAEGFRVTWLPVDGGGLIDHDALRHALGDDTLLVSIMAANNEIGTVQPVAEIGALCAEHGALFHTDAAQALGKIPLDVEAMNIALMSLSAHKAYGPMGIGALYVRRRPRVRLAPLFDGGGQERGLRSGTLPMPLCVGFGAACAIAGVEMAAESLRLRGQRDRLFQSIAGRLDGVTLNGDAAHRLSGNLNLRFSGVTGTALMGALEGLSVSSGSACTSAAVEPSYVLRAIGLDDAAADASIRIGFGRFTTDAELTAAADIIVDGVARLRAGAQPAVAE